MFSKKNFSYELLKSFTVNSLKKINRREEQKKLKQRILSSDYQSEIMELIKQDFLSQYDAELIDHVLQDLTIHVAIKNQTVFEKIIPEKEQNKSIRDKTKYIINQNGKRLPKNRFVLELVRAYLEEKPTDFDTLKKVFRDEYQGSTGVINRLDFVETKFANKSNKRHFTGNDEILESNDNVKFVVSTEWGKGNVDNIVNLARKNGFDIQEV